MACGLPVIATMHSGIPELVANGQAGYLVPEKDVDALADALRKLLGCPGLWSQMGQAGKTFVERNYEIKELNKKLIGIFSNTRRKR
jgi:colanic acid/amylovoran biosynthesis glycosyltransferase